MPSTEYYDRGLPEKKLHPASPSQQHCFDIARNNFLQAITSNLDAISEDFPEVGHAYLTMKTVLRCNPTREFKVFRPEDASMTLDADSNPAFVR